MESMTEKLNDALLQDKLQILAADYSVTKDLLITIAVKRLIDDVEFVRNLRAGKTVLE